MDAFPAFLPLHGRRVVIAGEGEQADAKARLFASSPATVERITGPAAFAVGTYAGAVVAFIASDDLLFRQAAASAARAAGVLVNVVDAPALSDFYTPAVIDRGQVVAAVGTDGSAPLLASMLRTDIEAHIPEGAGRLAALLKRRQAEVRAAFPDLSRRRAFLRSMVTGPVADAAMAGDAAEADRLFAEAIASGTPTRGAVKFVPGWKPVDLVPLRAARVLGAADVLVADEAAEPDMVSLARRDAHRLALSQASDENLAQLARAGAQVVWVLAAPLREERIDALTRLGVIVEVIRPAPAS